MANLAKGEKHLGCAIKTIYMIQFELCTHYNQNEKSFQKSTPVWIKSYGEYKVLTPYRMSRRPVDVQPSIFRFQELI